MGDISEADGRACVTGNDQRPVFVGFEELVGVGDVVGATGIGERAFGEIGVGGLQRAANGFETDVVTVQEIGIYLDADRGTRAAPSENLADAFHLGDFLREDGVGGVINLRRGNVVRREREKEDGSIGGIGFAIVGLAGKIGGKLTARGVDGSLDVASGGVDIAAEIELQSDVGGAEAAR